MRNSSRRATRSSESCCSGPSHYVAVKGLATSSAEAFATPLGLVPVDVEAVRQARSLPQVRELDEAHEHEHSLEVQLPFLQTVLGDFALVPLAVGDATPEEVGQVLDALWDGPETRFVISSDLSHYYDFQTARRLDAATAKAIEALKPGALARSAPAAGFPFAASCRPRAGMGCARAPWTCAIPAIPPAPATRSSATARLCSSRPNRVRGRAVFQVLLIGIWFLACPLVTWRCAGEPQGLF